MKLRTAVFCAIVALALAAPLVSQAREETPPPMTERAAAAVLLEDRITPERDRALELALELGSCASSELKGAVVHAAWAEWRNELDRPMESEAIYSYLHAVTELRDVRALPFLLEIMSPDGLADLGAVAFPPVLAAVMDPETHWRHVDNGLTALRFMVEDGTLFGRQLEQVGDIARERLSGTQDYFVIKAAVRLALASGDSELRRTVERIATDRDITEALVSPYLDDGTRSRNYERWVDRVQSETRLFLSGGGSDICPCRRPAPPCPR